MKGDGGGRKQQMSRNKDQRVFFFTTNAAKHNYGIWSTAEGGDCVMSVSPVNVLIKLAVFCSSFCAPQGGRVILLTKSLNS